MSGSPVRFEAAVLRGAAAPLDVVPPLAVVTFFCADRESSRVLCGSLGFGVFFGGFFGAVGFGLAVADFLAGAGELAGRDAPAAVAPVDLAGPPAGLGLAVDVLPVELGFPAAALVRVLEVPAALPGLDVAARRSALARSRTSSASRASSAACLARVAAGSGSNFRERSRGCSGESGIGVVLDASERDRAEPGIGWRGSSRSWMTGATIRITSSSLAEANGSRRTP